MISFTVKQDGETHFLSGCYSHSSFIGKPYGSKVYPKGKGTGHLYLLRWDPALITLSLSHLTQILYQTDISTVISKLNIKPGDVVIESGTGSGSLSCSILAALMGRGLLYTFEFNEGRVENAKELFKKIGYENYQVFHRDVMGLGFLATENETYKLQPADSIFLDLPRPYDVIKHAKLALKKSGRICCFSPCIEQVQKNSLELHSHGFIEVETIEVLKREYNQNTKILKTVFDTNYINVKRNFTEM